MGIPGTYPTVQITQEQSRAVRFLYNTLPGRVLLAALTRRVVSRLAGVFMSSAVSKALIKKFIRNNDVDMTEYLDAKYRSFNDFFTREIKKERRPFPDSEDTLASPCDGMLTAFRIEPDGVFSIKNSHYTIEDLLCDRELADEFAGGFCLIFRLMTNNYHRYAYIDDGEVLSSRKIKGVLHTVRPIVYDRYKVYARNSREYSVLQTRRFGKVVQMEVGALFVGRIRNLKWYSFKRGDERGMFEFGGSTVVMLFQKGTVEVDECFFASTRDGAETVVKMGCVIGERATGGV